MASFRETLHLISYIYLYSFVQCFDAARDEAAKCQESKRLVEFLSIEIDRHLSELRNAPGESSHISDGRCFVPSQKMCSPSDF
jgi:hypothetical protein